MDLLRINITRYLILNYLIDKHNIEERFHPLGCPPFFLFLSKIKIKRGGPVAAFAVLSLRKRASEQASKREGALYFYLEIKADKNLLLRKLITRPQDY